MAPFVKVPMNFGRHHLGSLTHSNLTINLQDGGKSRANSLILSFNSPVIERLVADLDLTSLDMDDFQKAAVDCFIDCLYTGGVEKMDRHIFREVHKMAQVFDVFWLANRCVGYFKELVMSMKEASYEDMVFLFEEAFYVSKAFKEDYLLDLAVQKIGAVERNKTLFIQKYMGNFSRFSKHELDVLIKLAGRDIHIPVRFLSDQIAKHPLVTSSGSILTENSRYFLNSCDLSLCRKSDVIVYENLFDVLQGLSQCSRADHLDWVLTLHRTSSKDTPISDSLKKIPNLFHSFDQFKGLSFGVLVDILGNDPKVKNIVMFAEALYCWMVEYNDKKIIHWSSELKEKIASIMQKRKWNVLPSKECLKFDESKFKVNFLDDGDFFDELMKWEALYLPEGESPDKCQLLSLINDIALTTPELLLPLRTYHLHFHFRHPAITACRRPGRCGFMLEITPATLEDPELFDIQLCLDHEKYDEDLHLHDDLVLAENMHVMIKNVNGDVIPISWNGRIVTEDIEGEDIAGNLKLIKWGPNIEHRLKRQHSWDPAPRRPCHVVHVLYNW